MPRGGEPDRFTGSDGTLGLHLVARTDRYGQNKLYLVEDATGLLVDTTDARVTAVGILAGRVRGQDHYRSAGRAGDFRAGAELALIREPDNPHDANSVGLAAQGSTQVAGHLSKAHARVLAKRLDAGQAHRGISTKGTPAGQPPEFVMHYLVAPADVTEHLLGTRPRGSKRPQFRS